MPYHKKGDAVFVASEHELFSKYFKPGDKVPVSGIYKCDTCGFEAVSTAGEGNPLPPAARCEKHHAAWKCEPGVVRWRLVAAAIHSNT
jgi:hypothetical protein